MVISQFRFYVYLFIVTEIAKQYNVNIEILSNLDT